MTRVICLFVSLSLLPLACPAEQPANTTDRASKDIGMVENLDRKM